MPVYCGKIRMHRVPKSSLCRCPVFLRLHPPVFVFTAKAGEFFWGLTFEGTFLLKQTYRHWRAFRQSVLPRLRFLYSVNYGDRTVVRAALLENQGNFRTKKEPEIGVSGSLDGAQKER